MAITGLNINLTVGAFTVNRLPWAELALERGAVTGRLRMDLPDHRGELAVELQKKDQVDLYFGYRGGLSQSWSGAITEIKAVRDFVKITAASPEQAFIETTVTECFHNETTRQVITRLIALAGLAPGRLEGPEEVIPHLIFSGRPVWECFEQINATLQRVYEYDMSAMAFWQDQNGLVNWGDFDEPGLTPIFASFDNLVNHNPKNAEEGEVVGLLCPGLTHSQLFTVKDYRRSEGLTKRALTVRHKLGDRGNLTSVTYGKENGYG